MSIRSAKFPLPAHLALTALLTLTATALLIAAPAPRPATSTAPSTTTTTAPSQTVMAAATDSINALIKDQVAADAMPLYSTIDHANETYTINPKSFLNSVKGAHAQAVYNGASAGNPSFFCPTYMGGVTCVTSTHVSDFPAGTLLKWVGDDGKLVSRKAVRVGKVTYAGPTAPDIAFLIIDAPLPTVSPMQFFDQKWSAYLNKDVFGTPLVWTDFHKKAFIADILALEELVPNADGHGRSCYRFITQRSTDKTRAGFYLTPEGGSSGSPGFIVLNNQAVFLSTLTGRGSSTAWGGAWTWYREDNWKNPTEPFTGKGWKTLIAESGGTVKDFSFSGFLKAK